MSARLFALAGLAAALGCSEPALRVLSPGAPASALPPDRGSPTETLRPLWSFHAGAPLQAAAGAAPGAVAVGSSDGYVHALREDGAYRWSYTLKGAIVAPPLIDGEGRVFAVTSSRRLYALTSGGGLSFSLALAGRPIAPMRWSSTGEILIATTEVAYAITRSGAIRTALALKDPPSSAPLALPAGKWLVGTRAGFVHEVGGQKPKRERVSESPIESLLGYGQKGYVALAGGRLVGEKSAENSQIVRFGCDGEQPIVISAAGRVGRIEPPAIRWLATLPTSASAAPACAADGRVLVPLTSGELAVVPPQGGAIRRYALAPAMLFTPQVDERLGRVLVSSAVGSSIALPLGAL